VAESPLRDLRVPPTGEVRARVSEFDERRGLGELMTESGRCLRFHCTTIADGTRSIAVDAQVTVTIVNGPLGDYEAAQLRPA
jgi:cold shock CspA family protein